MDDISGDIIYIVLTLIVVLFSAFRKKKAAQKPVSDPNREVSDPMDEVFPTLKDLFSEPEEEEAPFPQPAESLEPVVPSGNGPGSPGGRPFVKADYVFSARSSVKDPRRQRKIPKKIIDDNRVRTQANEEDTTGIEFFDLRSAIVYSEILKRPDF